MEYLPRNTGISRGGDLLNRTAFRLKYFWRRLFSGDINQATFTETGTADMKINLIKPLYDRRQMKIV